MDGQRQDDKLEPIYNSSVLMKGVALKTYREKGGGRVSGRSVPVVQHDDDEIAGKIILKLTWAHLFAHKYSHALQSNTINAFHYNLFVWT